MQAGDLQLWGIEQNAVLDSLPCADPITSIAQVAVSPYLCLGCESGDLLFVQLITKGGAPATGVCPATGLEMLPYERELSLRPPCLRHACDQTFTVCLSCRFGGVPLTP